MLVEKEFWGDYNKIENSIARIKEFEPMAINLSDAGYYVCISGGKDSSVIQELCIMAGVRCEFVHNHTSVDNPETVYFVRSEKERLEAAGYTFRIEYQRHRDGKLKTMWSGIYKKGLPTRSARWCCAMLKEVGGVGRYCITGVRWAESAARAGRGLHEEVTRKKDDRIILNNDNDMRRRLSESCIPNMKFILNPIVDWSDDDVWEFIKMRNLPVNPLYSQGYSRVGCIGCPLSGNGKADLEKYPKYKNAYFRATVRHFEYRKMRGLRVEDIIESPESYFEWWYRGL